MDNISPPCQVMLTFIFVRTLNNIMLFLAPNPHLNHYNYMSGPNHCFYLKPKFSTLGLKLISCLD